MSKLKTGWYRIRVRVLSRVLAVAGANGEQVESWLDPGDGVNEYFAGRDRLTSGEQISDGIRQSMGSMKLRIKGRAIPVSAVDRLKIVATGEVFNITAVSREAADTVLMVDRATQQDTPQ